MFPGVLYVLNIRLSESKMNEEPLTESIHLSRIKDEWEMNLLSLRPAALGYYVTLGED